MMVVEGRMGGGGKVRKGKGSCEYVNGKGRKRERGERGGGRRWRERGREEKGKENILKGKRKEERGAFVGKTGGQL